jgi:ankyrin repeat protein
MPTAALSTTLTNQVINTKMTTRRISVNVGGLWRTSVELKEEAKWRHLKIEIEKVTSIPSYCQKLSPDDKNSKKCELEEGDDVFCDWKLSYGGHPLHHAAYFGNIEAIRSWLASGADVNVANIYEQTPLMQASVSLEEECVMELLRLGANVQIKDDDDNTALFYVVHNHNLEKMERIAKMLIKAGCDPIMRNNQNETFIDILKKHNCNELAMELEKWIKETTE